MTKYVSYDNLARYTVKMKKNIADRVKEVTDKEGAANGVATLGADGKLTAAQLPALKSVNGVSVVGSGNISIDLSLYKVVDSLPTTGIDATKIYIVPAKTTEDKNIKAEYVYTGNPASAYDASKWEKLGEAQTNIVVDVYLSDTSINPVQNRTLKIAIDNLNNSVTSANSTLGELSSRISTLSIKNNEQDTAIAGKLDKTDYVVDTELSETSTNPLQNKTVWQAVNFITTTLDEVLGEKLNKTDYVVDNELSPTSKNPVQNLVVYHEFDWFGKNIRDKAYVQINAMAPAGIQVPPGTAFAIVPNPVTSEAYADDGGWHGRELTFNGALFATKAGLDSCLKKTDMTAITNEEIDAMF